MKAPAGFIWVQVCWNNDRGNFDDELFRIEIDEEIVLESGILEGAQVILLEAAPEKELPFDSFELGGENFEFVDRHRWLGSVAWDGLLMKEEDALRLVKTAAKVGFTEESWAVDGPYIKAFKEVQSFGQGELKL